MQVTPKNFFTDFLLNPLSDQISKTDRAICLIASFALGVLTVGLLHLGMAIYNWNTSKVEKDAFDWTNLEDLPYNPNYHPFQDNYGT